MWALQFWSKVMPFKMIIYFLLIIIILNISPLILSEGQLIITIDLLKSLIEFKESSFPFNLGVHIIASISFTITFLIFKNRES